MFLQTCKMQSYTRQHAHLIPPTDQQDQQILQAYKNPGFSVGLLYWSFRRTPNRGRTKTPEMIRGLSRWRGNQTFSVTCWKASMWLRKTCVSQSLIGGEGLCVYSKACEWPFWKICSTIMCIFQTKDLHRFTSQPLTVWTAIFPTCHHGSFHPPFTKPFRYPKVNYHGHILSSLQKPGLRHLEGLRLYSPSLFFKGWNVNPVKWMRFPQWGLTLQRSFFSASWPQARCPERPF